MNRSASRQNLVVLKELKFYALFHFPKENMGWIIRQGGGENRIWILATNILQFSIPSVAPLPLCSKINCISSSHC